MKKLTDLKIETILEEKFQDGSQAESFCSWEDIKNEFLIQAAKDLTGLELTVSKIDTEGLKKETIAENAGISVESLTKISDNEATIVAYYITNENGENSVVAEEV